MNLSLPFQTLCVLLSAVLTCISFPNILFFNGIPWIAYFSLIPYFFVLERSSLSTRLGLGILWNVICHGLFFSWLIPFNGFGYAAVILITSIPSILFAVLFATPNRISSLSLSRILYIPALWVMTEFLRTIISGGYGWALGNSQGAYPTLLQISDVTGIYGVSFLIVFINVCLYRCFFLKEKQKWLYIIYVFVILNIVIVYGSLSLGKISQEKNLQEPFNICSIEPHIPPETTLHLESMGEILNEHIRLSYQCLAQGKVDLIVWPETSLTVDVLKYPNISASFKRFAQEINVPILMGAVLFEGDNVLNSAIFWRKGTPQYIYSKKHLIPFAEYFPWPKGIKKHFYDKDYEFSAGKSLGIFPMNLIKEKVQGQVGITICSEDGYAALFRKLLDHNAAFVIVMLNDAWMGQSPALMIHLQNSIVRAVEFRIPVLRSSNNGITGLIHETGESVLMPSSFSSPRAQIFKVYPYQKRTIYMFFGDIFALLCAIFVIINVIPNFSLPFSFKRKK